MECRRCASPLERPGDYCLVCNTPNADTVVIDAGRERARVVTAHDGDVVGERVVTTVPHDDERERKEIRNFAGRVADELRRKRPEEVYARGDRSVVREISAQIGYELRRTDEPVESVLSEDDGLETVETPPGDKIGGRHSTIIGERQGREAVVAVAEHPHVKKIVPGPISSGGGGASGGFGAKVTRSDANGNLRLIIRDGSSVQENRVVTTAGDREAGERVRDELNDAL